MPQVRQVAQRPGRTCPLCRDVLDEAHEEHVWACPACETRYHAECAHELGGCATAGCAQRGERPRGAPVLRVDPKRGVVEGGYVGAGGRDWRRGLRWGINTTIVLLVIGIGLGVWMADFAGFAPSWANLGPVIGIGLVTGALVGLAAALGAP